MSHGRLQQWTNLLSVLKYGLFFFVVLTYLPFTAFRQVPGSSLLGGLFVDLVPIDVFWTAIAFFGAAWSLSFTVGLIVDTAERRWDPDAEPMRRRAERLAEAGPTPKAEAPGLAVYLPDWAVRFFGVPTTKGHLRVATGQAVLGLLVVLGHTEDKLLGTVAAVAGFFTASILLFLLSMPARLLDTGVFPVPTSFLGKLLFRLCNRPFLVRLSERFRNALSRLFAWLRLDTALEEATEGGVRRKRLRAEHFFALSCFLGVVLLVLLAAWLFFPPSPILPLPSSASLVYILLALLVWTLLGMDCHLARFRLSPVLILVGWMLFVWWLEMADHDYRVTLRPAAEVPLTPVDVARASRAPENLVLVASSGGGILAAGWTTLALERLAAERPALVNEVRLLSTISGSSVGAAYYAAHFQGAERDPARLSREELQRDLISVYEQSVKSSLGEAAYGFAMLDFWRLFFARPPLFSDWDRGRLVENAWGRIDGEVDLPLSALREPIRQGRIPALIMGTTVLEKGQRVMITPLAFPPTAERERSSTLNEFLAPGAGQEADPLLWTAARLSATFPFVSPAARASFWDEAGKEQPVQGNGRLHLLDGGYFDNYGVTSALDWLDPVLAARLASDPGLRFKRVVIVRLNAFSAIDPTKVKPISGSLAALAGPLVGIVNLRTGVAMTRNAIDLSRYLDSWNARFAAAGAEVCVEQIELRPPEIGDQPLSWHMTKAQIAEQQKAWDTGFAPDQASVPGSLRQQWETMKAFLDRPACAAEAAPMVDEEEMLGPGGAP